MAHAPIDRRETARRWNLVVIAATATLLAGTTGAEANCAPCHDWSWLAPSAGRPTTPFFANGVVVHSTEGDIFLRRPHDGSPAAQRLAPGPDIWRAPAMVQLPDTSFGQWYVFATSPDGYLRKYAVPDPIPPFGTADLEIATISGLQQVRDMRRGACPADSLLAEPIVQRRVDSNAQFTLDEDIVIVATAHGCGDTTGNQVVALDAEDITQPPVWVFNVGDYEIGRVRTCLLDLERNQLYCVAELPSASFQLGVLTINTVTGSLVWGEYFAGGVHARPALGEPGSSVDGHLYVGDQLGRLHSVDAADGTLIDSITISTSLQGPTPGIMVDLTVGMGVYAGMVFAVDGNGKISAVYDSGTDLIVAWESSFAGGQKVVTQALPIDALGKLYAGTYDGKFHQLDMASGSDEASAEIGIVIGTPATSDTFALGAYQAANGLYRVVGTVNDPGSGTRTTHFRVPCLYGSDLCRPAPLELIMKNGFE